MILSAGAGLAACASLQSSAARCFRSTASAWGPETDSLQPLSASWLRLEGSALDTTGVAIIIDSVTSTEWQGRWWRFRDSLRVDAAGGFDAHWLRLAQRDSALVGRARVAIDVLERDSAGVLRPQETRWNWLGTPIECRRVRRDGRLPQN